MNAPDNQLPQYSLEFVEALHLKKRLFRQVEGDVKKYLNLYYSAKDQ